MDDDDIRLVALIDGELDKESRRDLLARMERDEGLRLRYERLRDGPASIAAAFDSLLKQAPVERLRAALPPETSPARGRWFAPGFALRELAAGFVAGLIVAGAAAWIAFALAPGDEDDWRSAVVDYMRLYTNDTFAMPNPPPQIEAAQLQAVGERVGAQLTSEKIALPDLDFKVAFILSYEGSPLGEIAFTEPTGAPVLVCVIDAKSEDAPIRVEKRDGFTLASWSRDGRGYLVIGRIPAERAKAWARMLNERI